MEKGPCMGEAFDEENIWTYEQVVNSFFAWRGTDSLYIFPMFGDLLVVIEEFKEVDDGVLMFRMEGVGGFGGGRLGLNVGRWCKM